MIYEFFFIYSLSTMKEFVKSVIFNNLGSTNNYKNKLKTTHLGLLAVMFTKSCNSEKTSIWNSWFRPDPKPSWQSTWRLSWVWLESVQFRGGSGGPGKAIEKLVKWTLFSKKIEIKCCFEEKLHCIRPEMIYLLISLIKNIFGNNQSLKN